MLLFIINIIYKIYIARRIIIPVTFVFRKRREFFFYLTDYHVLLNLDQVCG
jgi:hypothetical protein